MKNFITLGLLAVAVTAGILLLIGNIVKKVPYGPKAVIAVEELVLTDTTLHIGDEVHWKQKRDSLILYDTQKDLGSIPIDLMDSFLILE